MPSAPTLRRTTPGHHGRCALGMARIHRCPVVTCAGAPCPAGNTPVLCARHHHPPGSRSLTRPRHPGRPLLPRRRPPAAWPSEEGQIKGLDAFPGADEEELRQFAGVTPGPADIFDYNMGALWPQGLDGAATTIAVMRAVALP